MVRVVLLSTVFLKRRLLWENNRVFALRLVTKIMKWNLF